MITNIVNMYYQFTCGHKILLENTTTVTKENQYTYITPSECQVCKQISTSQYHSTIGSRIF